MTNKSESLLSQHLISDNTKERQTPELTGRGERHPIYIARGNDEKHPIRAPVE
jgi:hypothetical protein